MYTVLHKWFWSTEHEARALDKKSFKRNLLNRLSKFKVSSQKCSL